MAIQQTPQADEFKRKLRNVFQRETFSSHAIRLRAMLTSMLPAFMQRFHHLGFNIQLHLPCFMGWPETCGSVLVRLTGTDAEESLSRSEAVQRCDDPRDHGGV